MNNDEENIVNTQNDVNNAANVQQSSSISKEDLEEVLKEFLDTKEELKKKDEELKEKQKEIVQSNIDTNVAIKEANTMSFVSLSLLAFIVGIILGSIFWRHLFKKV